VGDWSPAASSLVIGKVPEARMFSPPDERGGQGIGWFRALVRCGAFSRWTAAVLMTFYTASGGSVAAGIGVEDPLPVGRSREHQITERRVPLHDPSQIWHSNARYVGELFLGLVAHEKLPP
jgi:hypothetical protein